MKYVFNFIVASFLTICDIFLGGLDIALSSFFLIIIIDYITGVLQAIYNKKLNSKIGIKGFIKKLCFIIAIAVSVIVDKLIGSDGVIRDLVVFFFISNESISIMENLGKMGVKLPKKLFDVLEQLKGDDKDDI